MLPAPHHSQFIVPRIEATLQRVRSMIWTVDWEHPLEVWQATPTREPRPVSRISELDFAPAPSAPFVWGRKFDQCWWRVRLPENAGGCYFHWRDMGEATLYIDGVPYQGLDIAHPYALLPQGVREVLVESICCNTGIWVTGSSQGITPKGSEFQGAFLATRNEAAWKVFHDLDVLFNLFQEEYAIHVPKGNASPYGHATPLDSASPALRIITRAFFDAMAALDREGLEAASAVLDAVYAKLRGKGLGECVLTDHAHIDLVWLWPERVGEFKAVHSFATMNRLMERYPEFRFGYSQPASYEAVARRSPELFREVCQRIRIAIGLTRAHLPREEQPAALADILYTTPLPCGGPAAACGFLGLDGGSSLLPAWAKPVAPGQWVLRLHETAGLRGTANLLLENGWRTHLADLRDTPHETPLADGRISFSPFQILSVLIRRDESLEPLETIRIAPAIRIVLRANGATRRTP